MDIQNKRAKWHELSNNSTVTTSITEVGNKRKTQKKKTEGHSDKKKFNNITFQSSSLESLN